MFHRPEPMKSDPDKLRRAIAKRYGLKPDEISGHTVAELRESAIKAAGPHGVAVTPEVILDGAGYDGGGDAVDGFSGSHVIIEQIAERRRRQQDGGAVDADLDRRLRIAERIGDSLGWSGARTRVYDRLLAEANAHNPTTKDNR